MADVKSAQQLLKDLPRNDALKALAEIADWIESVRDNAEFVLDQRFDVLNLLDEAAQPHVHKLMHDYFSPVAISQFQESRTWMALSEYFSQIGQAYIKLLAAYRAGEKGSSAVKSKLSLVTARGIHALMGRLKFAAARYAQVEATLWKQLAEFYSYAEAQQYLNDPIQLYSGSSPTTTVREQFVGLLMWYAPGSSTLSPQNMHLAERLAAHFCGHFRVDTQPVSGSLFYFDFNQPVQILRVLPETTSLPSMRFISAGDVLPQVEALLKALEKNVVPDDINLGGVYSASEICDVVQHLLVYWGAPPPMRRNVRRPIKVNMDVAHGYANVVELAAAEKANEADRVSAGQATGAATGMTWVVEDISATGFRCVLTTKGAEGVRIGSLVGIRPENVGNRGVGIVRRLNRDGQNSLHVGVEILGKQVESVTLHAQGRSAAGRGQAALWLVKREDELGEVCLLMNADTFSMNISLHTHFEEKKYLLIPLVLLEKGVDYDYARYRKVEEDPAATGDDY